MGIEMKEVYLWLLLGMDWQICPRTQLRIFLTKVTRLRDLTSPVKRQYNSLYQVVTVELFVTKMT